VRSAALLVERIDLDKSSKSAITKRYHDLSGLDVSFDTYPRCALPMAIIFAPFQDFKELLKQALILAVG